MREKLFELPEHIKSMQRKHRAMVAILCEDIGYGAVMHYAESLWADIEGNRKSNHTVGPCAVFMVPCEHQGSDNGAVGCDWCCGSGRVTTRVLEAMRAEATKDQG